MLRKLKGFTNQLTVWASSIEELDFATEQLKKRGAKENRDFIIKPQGNEYAVFLNYESYTVSEY